MGMDVYGKSGNYFRNNCWWWRPLWDYTASVCQDIITDTDADSGHYNDGHLIDSDKCNSIVERLESLLKDGSVKEYELEYQKRLDSLEKDDFNSHYPFSEENVKGFMEFVKDSGGFEIY